MKLRLLLPIVVAAACLQPAVNAQRPDREDAERLRGRFSDTGLEVGLPFPEVDIFDDQGNPFNTRSLKGKYTVVINGCLT